LVMYNYMYMVNILNSKLISSYSFTQRVIVDI